MNASTPEHHARQRATDRTRSNAFSAGIAALCLLYFGFFGGYTSPQITGLFSVGNLIFFYCLRVGGVAMAIIAVVSVIGAPVILICDAVVSITIGGLLMVSAGMMLLDGGGGLNPFLMIIFGAMFVSAGLRNGRAFIAFRDASATYGNASRRPRPVDGSDSDPRRGAPAPDSDASPRAVPSGSLAGQLLRHTRDDRLPTAEPTAATLPKSHSPAPGGDGSGQAASSSPAVVPVEAVKAAPMQPGPDVPVSMPPGAREPETAQTESPPPDAPEDGFLASFAPRKDDGSS